MLEFFSASTRMVNARRGITECMEVAMGNKYSSCDLVILHASVGHNFPELTDQIKQLAPNAKIVASSCCGIVGREGVSESMKDIAIMAIRGKEFAVSHADGVFGYNSYEKCVEIAQDLYKKDAGVNMIYFMASGIDIANDQCIAAIESVFGSDVTIFGATSSDNMHGAISYQAVDNTVFEHAAFMVGFSDPSLVIDTQATHGFVAVGEPMTVTKADGYRILELDNKPAWSEFIHRLGLPDTAGCGDTIPIGALAEQLSPELAAEYGNQHILRVVTRHKDEAILYPTTISEGTKLWLTTRNEILIFNEMDNMVESMIERMKGKTLVAMFHADCLARGRFLFNRVLKEEIVSRMQTPFSENGVCPPWLGMYGFGEFARLGGKNTYHNYTTALYAIYRK
ncbi:MAG: FIST N-terminal domain-containing protein [Bacteroidota bacterium]